MTTKQQRACLGILTAAFVLAAVAWGPGGASRTLGFCGRWLR
jgi:hypothetical protein